MSKKDNTPANAQQIKFATEYFRTGKKRQSAIEAGYSPASAHSQATTLLNNPTTSNDSSSITKVSLTPTALS